VDHESAWTADDDAYATLGVRPDADDAAIVAAYRALARRHHPDIAGDTQTVRMSQINAAFNVLRDRARRDRYDQDTGRPSRPAPQTSRPVRQPPRHAHQAPRPAQQTSERPVDPARPPYGWVAERDGTGGAGAPPGRPSGTVLTFGRHAGWSIGEIARVDPGYLEWLERRLEGGPYLDEIDATLRRIGHRTDDAQRPIHDPRNRFRRSGWS
jgi:curved DNA-binding protein CbpA